MPNHVRKFLVCSAAVTVQLFTALESSAQNGLQSQIITDAIVSRGSELEKKQHVDIYISVPYQSMEFNAYNNKYASQYKASIILRDMGGRKVVDSTITRSMVTEDYAVAHGATGAADNVVLRFPVKEGEYRYEVFVDDLFSQREFTSQDTVRVRDLSFTPSMSSIMYVSQIEQRGSRFRITPYVGSRIWDSNKQLFAFFEFYDDKLPITVVFDWAVTDASGKELGSGMSSPEAVTERASQHFFPLRGLETGLPGEYTLTVQAHPHEGGSTDTTVILASNSRRYTIPRTLQGSILSDLDLAVRQLVYVADQDQIDIIEAAPDAQEKRRRFEDFWKRLDPSRNTVRNEAFDEYYRRITAANLRFKSYAQGWETDMGRVFIIYGEPANVERQTSGASNALLIRWTYSNSLQFLFEDTSGFGDYRLRTPFPPSQKFEYP